MTSLCLQGSTHSLTFQFIKGYKELLKKIQGAHLDESKSMVQHSNQVLQGMELQQLQAEIRIDRAFVKLKEAILETDLRALYHASKQRAKEKLHTASKALDEKYARYLSGSQASTSQPATQIPTAQALQPEGAQQAEQLDLEPLYGSDGYLRRAVVYLIGRASQTYLNVLNTTEVQNLQVMEQALSRPKGQALITVSNHVAAMDDPLVMSAIIPEPYLSQPEHLRWTLCATDRCFKYSALVPFFRAAKVLPVQRGGGMKQRGMLAAEAKLAAGDWVHIFPEGTRSKDGKLGPVRKGVGRLVASCAEAPLVVPFVHSGMEQVMPRGKVVPRIGKQVKVLVGQPIPVADLLQTAAAAHWTEDQLHAAISKRIAYHLHKLKHTLEGTEMQEEDPLQPSVSSLDLYDMSDLQHQRQTWWEKLNFKMQHRQWLHNAVTVQGASVPEQLGHKAAAELSRDEVVPEKAGNQPTLVQTWAAVRSSHALVKHQQLRDYSWQRTQAMMNMLQATSH